MVRLEDDGVDVVVRRKMSLEVVREEVPVVVLVIVIEEQC